MSKDKVNDRLVHPMYTNLQMTSLAFSPVTTVIR